MSTDGETAPEGPGGSAQVTITPSADELNARLESINDARVEVVATTADLVEWITNNSEDDLAGADSRATANSLLEQAEEARVAYTTALRAYEEDALAHTSAAAAAGVDADVLSFAEIPALDGYPTSVTLFRARLSDATAAAAQKGDGKGRGDAPDKGKHTRNQGKASEYHGFAGLSVDQKKLIEALEQINGQDAYSSEAQALGRVNQSNWMAIPKGMAYTAPDLKDLGSSKAALMADRKFLAQVYALNKARCSRQQDAPKYALLRMEAVKAGWYRPGQNQDVILVDPILPQEATKILVGDLGELATSILTAKQAGYLIPYFAEHTFRTMGHHYLSSDASTYIDRYTRTAKACLVPELMTYLPAELMWHEAMHWVSPRIAYEALIKQLDEQTMPDAIRIRANAAPAGTAVVTTTCAVLDAMDSAALKNEFVRYGGYNLDLIVAMKDKIKADPRKYHKSYFAYGVSKLSAQEVEELELAKADAIKFAPISQAFIVAYLRDAELSKARALQKHAQTNPIIQRRAERFFRSLARKEVTDIRSIFSDKDYNAEADA